MLTIPLPIVWKIWTDVSGEGGELVSTRALAVSVFGLPVAGMKFLCPDTADEYNITNVVLNFYDTATSAVPSVQVDADRVRGTASTEHYRDHCPSWTNPDSTN